MFCKSLENDACLALLEPRHAQEMALLIDANRAHLRRWLPWVDAMVTVRDSRQWIKEALRLFAEGREMHMGLWVDGNLAGVLGAQFLQRNHSAMLGYWLGALYQGRGLMTAACRAVIDHCFAGLGLNRVEIRCAVENHRSRAIPQRLGFRQEGTIRAAEWLYDHYVDHVVYGLLRREWEAARVQA
ncbi:MAG: GNAT family N-acetyltransferase [Firmicutes bacterium]|nr:GNAT family N-acetyltransferase [Bacillota bacterium]HOB34305.1 GNAT family protein [Bacillota bacterium]HPZ90688.1 GNAT family protein [Bacillota bacterium]HQE01516.1 GNAT family protein [Bacillota bacterium]